MISPNTKKVYAGHGCLSKERCLTVRLRTDEWGSIDMVVPASLPVLRALKHCSHVGFNPRRVLTCCLPGKSPPRRVYAYLACQAHFANIFRFSEYSDYPISRLVPPHQKGRIMIVANAGWDAMDADGVSDEGA